MHSGAVTLARLLQPQSKIKTKDRALAPPLNTRTKAERTALGNEHSIAFLCDKGQAKKETGGNWRLVWPQWRELDHLTTQFQNMQNTHRNTIATKVLNIKGVLKGIISTHRTLRMHHPWGYLGLVGCKLTWRTQKLKSKHLHSHFFDRIDSLCLLLIQHEPVFIPILKYLLALISHSFHRRIKGHNLF